MSQIHKRPLCSLSFSHDSNYFVVQTIKVFVAEHRQSTPSRPTIALTLDFPPFF